MGGKGSKGSKEAQVAARPKLPVRQFEGGSGGGGGEVKIATRLSASALLAQELHHVLRLQAQTELAEQAKQAHQQLEQVSSKPKRKKKETKSEEVSEESRLAVALARHMESWAELRHKLDDRFQQASSSYEEDGSNQALVLLTRLPPEVVCVVLSFIDYPSLLAFSAISAWGYGVVHGQSEALVHAKLVEHVRLVRSTPVADAAVIVEAALGASPAQPVAEPSPAGVAARLLIAPSMEADAALINPDITGSVEVVFDPHVEENMKAFASIRTFSVPRALYAFGEDVGQAVASGLANVEIKFSVAGDGHEGDAWSYNPLKFGPKLEPMTSIEQFDQALQMDIKLTFVWCGRMHRYKGVKEIKWHGDEVIAVKVPTASEALKAVSYLVASDELLLWRDTQFTGRGLGGHRFLVVGGRQAAMVQWEYYANFCGGPYANYDCGMG